MKGDYDPETDPEIEKSEQRSVADVIAVMAMSIGQLDHVGFSVEPVAMLSDPDDEVAGDYVIRVCFEVKVVEGKAFAKVFHANIMMGLFLRMNDERFKRNIWNLFKNVANFKADKGRELDEAGYLTGKGMQNLSDVIRSAEKKGKH